MIPADVDTDHPVVVPSAYMAHENGALCGANMYESSEYSFSEAVTVLSGAHEFRANNEETAKQIETVFWLTFRRIWRAMLSMDMAAATVNAEYGETLVAVRRPDLVPPEVVPEPTPR